MVRLIEQQKKELVEALRDYLDEAEYSETPAEYIADMLTPMIEEWIEHRPGYTLDEREVWKVRWADGTIEYANSLIEARLLVRFWDYEGVILKGNTITYTKDWEEVETHEPTGE